MKDLLEKIAVNPAREAKWLNTLSLLEFIGARKISKTVCQTHPSLEVLQHFSDETHHAFVFKELSHIVSKGKCSAYLCQDQAVSYFQMLDASLSEWLSELTDEEDTYSNYLLVTCLIERRAMKIYPLYKEVTQNPEVKKALARIIKEEGSHRKSIDARIKAIFSKKGNRRSMELCLALEEKLFGLFEHSLRKELH